MPLKTPPKRVMQLLGFSILLWIFGLGLIIWKAGVLVAIGVFLCFWANNVLK